MRGIFSAARHSAKKKSAVDLKSFSGLDFTSFRDGALTDAENVTVMSGGAISSLLHEKKLNFYTDVELRDGVYTLCNNYDPEYETPVSRDWIYKNVFPERVRPYAESECSRLLVKGIGMPPKTKDGYRSVKGAYSDGERLFIFYEARYNIIDNYRDGIFEAVGSALAWRFYSGEENEKGSVVNFYTLTQLFLDVIDGGSVESSLVDAKLDLARTVTADKYKWSCLISEDKVNYKYTSTTYIPIVGQAYTAYFDRVYTELYGSLEEENAKNPHEFSEKSIIVYNNLEDGGDEFSAAGTRLLVLPDMRLLVRSNARWKMSDEVCGWMPDIEKSVQLYDRLYAISGEKLYVSRKEYCTDFNTEDELKEGAPFEMSTADAGGFTAIAAFGGRVAVFTRKSMLTLRGSELPFTLSHEADCGCTGSLATVSGKLCFVSENGIFQTGGGTPVCISGSLPKEVDYLAVTLSSFGGMLLASVPTLEKILVYNPASSAWSTLSLCGDVHAMIDDFVILREGGGFAVYRLFSDTGDFEFSVALENRGRKRLKSVAVTASAAPDSELCLYDDEGNVLLEIYAPSDVPVTKTVSLRREYIDHAKLRFGGFGDVTVYGIRCEV